MSDYILEPKFNTKSCFFFLCEWHSKTELAARISKIPIINIWRINKCVYCIYAINLMIYKK